MKSSGLSFDILRNKINRAAVRRLTAVGPSKRRNKHITAADIDILEKIKENTPVSYRLFVAVFFSFNR
ncbi:uncharacterized protein ARB_07647 [Trichophyton benhamiae CBS 112371]|uniref:Uncharacterized protein n=1 Tax=Arthroderma benhamiae (strain ATCC MYA-4681 / CBS 112371) TaxID=663331 RepID=D4ATT1_ARTBC|nr:uncharacterized protein ARB_07647 [Trichophyton benhamiae CBS 112371]EFE33700.1 hypothetical protein ARB_07647 [Trichophyton benhamiae CBS 112371]